MREITLQGISTGFGSGSEVQSLTYAYDRLGNITRKGAVSDYRYGENGAGPHAVSHANGSNYSYDANGNMTG